MKNLTKYTFLFFLILWVRGITFGQVAPTLGEITKYSTFTVSGNISNTGISYSIGDVGTNAGAISGFSYNINGTFHDTDPSSALASTDLVNAYSNLGSQVSTSTLGTTLGNGQTLTPAVHLVSGNTLLTGNLMIDAQGNPNAVFIIKINGNLTIANFSSIHLINGAKACNIFWRVTGTITNGNSTHLMGNYFAGSTITTGVGSKIEGRLATINGSITVNSSTINHPYGCGLTTLHGPAMPNVGSLGCFSIFNDNGTIKNTGTTTITGDVGTNSGIVDGFDTSGVNGMIHYTPDAWTIQGEIDNLALYNELNAVPCDIQLLKPNMLGYGLRLTPHTYCLGSNTHLSDTLYFDAQGNPNAVFIMQIGGNFDANSYSNVVLLDSAQAKNIFWVINGNVGIAPFSIFRGTIIASNGAESILENVFIEGRILSHGGAIKTHDINIVLNETPNIITPDGPLTFCFGDSVVLTGPESPSYLWSTGATTQSITVFTTGTYSVQVTAPCNNMASEIHVNVVVIPAPFHTSFVEICQGDSALINGNYRTSAGNYDLTFPMPFGCDSVSRTTLIVNPTHLTNLTAEICQGESILLGGANQTTAGIYFDTLATNKGCDSVLRTTLIVNPIYLTNLSAEICQGESILLGGANQTTAGIYFDTLATNKGCDSVLRTTLIVNPIYLTNLSAEICQGESILLGGANQTTAGIYFDTLATNKGCDSVLRTTLIVNPTYLTNLTAEICLGESILLGGANQTTAGIYFDTLATNKGCDSVLRTTLIVNPTYLTNLSAEICQGESILLGGSNQTTAGIYFDTLATNKGCDSVLRTTLIVNPTYLTNLTAEICQGESILLGGANQTTAGIYFDTLSTNKGCDSVLRTTLIVNPIYLTNLTAEICQGESILLGGSNQTTAGIYFDTLATNKGCDSVLRTTLIINPIYLTNLTAEICQGESILLGGANQTTAGIYFDTLSTNKGCDSVLRTTLIVNPTYLTNLTAEICQGESILLGGSNQTTAGIYFDTLSTNKGCDSVLRTTLIVNPTYLTNLTAEICQGESILLGGANQTTAGIYFDTLSTNKGCDSVLRTTLIVNPIYLTNLTAEICQGESILLGGANQTTVGIYFDTLSTNKGCDSVLRTTLIVNPIYLTNLTAEICQGESILLGGANQTTAGIYYDTLSTNKGCDSVLRTTLIVNPIYLTNLTAEICQGESILLGGANQTTAGIYFDTLSTNKGCDSVLRTTLIVNPIYLTNLTAEICQGESILLGGANQTTAGIYFDTLATNKGCDSVLRTTLIVNPTHLTILTAEICQGESIMLGGSNQTTAGIYFDTLSTNKGCDSVLRTTLIVNPIYLTNLTAEICQGEGILLGGANQTTAGIYFDTISTNKGCDSVLRTTLIVNPTYLTNLTAEICQGESILLGGANQTTAGIYFDTISTNKGCDSVLRTTLIVNPIYLTNLTAEICQGESILLGGANQTTAGIYFDTISTNKGCDSVLRTTLIVNPTYLTNLTAEICQGESILLGGSNQTTAGIYFDTLSTNKGCDSVLRTTLIVNPTYLTNLTAEICQGESILLGGANQTTAGIYFDTLSTNKGCDSVLSTTLIVNPTYLTNLTAEICQGESILLGGSNQTTAGIYFDTLSTNKGCDSVLRTTLIVNPIYLTNLTAEICQGEGILLGGANQTTAGIYFDTISTNKGCDSVLRTTLIVNPTYLTNLTAEICQGESILLGGANQTTAGIYFDTISTNKGCDSVLRTTLIVNPIYLTNLTAEICQGESILLGGANQTTAGIYFDTISTNKGCDSVLRTTLIVNPTYLTNLTAEICQGESILLGGSNQTTAGIYFDTLSTNKGCDSVLRTTLIVNPTYLTNLTAEICQGESILLGGANQTTAGIYFDTLSTNKGCDSVLRTTLIVNPTYLTNLTAEICQGESIFLGGANQTTAGIYFDTLSTNKGCDSVLRTTLIVNPGHVVSVYSSICEGESIFLSGSVRTTPGVYIDSLQTATGCDSTVYNVLSVNPSYDYNLTLTICEGDSALIFGQYQHFAGTYIQSLTTQFGCDSIRTIVLEVNPIVNTVQSITICEGDSLSIGGVYQTQPGVYYDVFQTLSGCDSVKQINLLVKQNVITTIYVSICEGTHYLFGELMLTSTGSYFVTIPSETGCDSIINTILTVHPNKEVFINTSICEGDSILLGGQYVTLAGTYSDTLATSKGCDSVVITKLKLLPDPTALFSYVGVNESSFNFYNLSTNSNSFYWDFGDGYYSVEEDPFHLYTLTGSYPVELIATNKCGSDTSIIQVNPKINLDFYNGFSPNGDGKNDYWNIPILDYFADNNVTIINRWGNEVWITENYDNEINRFEGRNINGEALADGTYFYIIKYGDVEKRGWVFIKR